MSDKTQTEHKGWIGVDLDGTLAKYDGWKGADHIGEPVSEMVRKVRLWLGEGKDVRIFTARVAKRLELDDGSPTEDLREADRIQIMIQDWSEKHIGVRLQVTCVKDYGMELLYDDRCVHVFPNEGITHKEHQGFLQSAFVDVAAELGVKVRHGANFKEVADECASKARSGAAARAQQYEAVLSLFDGAEDALTYFVKQLQGWPDTPVRELDLRDLTRVQNNIRRALPMLRELAGRKG